MCWFVRFSNGIDERSTFILCLLLWDVALEYFSRRFLCPVFLSFFFFLSHFLFFAVFSLNCVTATATAAAVAAVAAAGGADVLFVVAITKLKWWFNAGTHIHARIHSIQCKHERYISLNSDMSNNIQKKSMAAIATTTTMKKLDLLVLAVVDWLSFRNSFRRRFWLVHGIFSNPFYTHL